MIEAAFEGSDISLDLSTKDERRATSFARRNGFTVANPRRIMSGFTFTNPDAVMRGIMTNIIANKGTFTP